MIDLSKIYKQIQKDNLKFFEDGGPFEEERVNTTNPDLPGYIGNEVIAGDGNQWRALLPPNEGGIQALERPPLNDVIIPETDLTQGGNSTVFQRNPDYQSLGQKVEQEIGTTPTPVSTNYDALSFGEAFKKANREMGDSGQFIYRGKKFNTNRASSGASTASTSKGTSAKNTIASRVPTKVEPTSKYTSQQSAEINKQKALIQKLQEDYTASKDKKSTKTSPTSSKKDEHGRPIWFRGQQYYLEPSEAQLQGWKNIGDNIKKSPVVKDVEKINTQIRGGAKAAAEAVGKGKIWFRGERYDLKPKAGVRKWLNDNFEEGGKIPEYEIGGPTSLPGGQYQLTPDVEEQLRRAAQAKFSNYIGADGIMSTREELNPQNILTASQNMKRTVFDPITGRQKQININEGDRYDKSIDDFYNSEGQVAERDSQQKAQMDFFSQLQNAQQYDVPEDLNMIGKSLAFEASDDKYTTDTSKKAAQGANLARGIFAGLDAVVGGGREVFSGYATQKRQNQSEQDYYRRQREALEKSRTQYGAEGGQIQNILDMFGEETEEKQQSRTPIPVEQSMTGEFIQQNPNGAGVPPNAELERKEYVQYPDGEVQQVVGRSHAQGGEKLALEGGTNVISDKVKLGAKNARALNKEYGLNVKAGDTYAKSIEKFTKKIGLEKTNTEQEDYFKKLKKVTDVSKPDPDTSEINNAFLSEKINDLEQKKEALSTTRSEFTDYIYQLQQESKPPEEREEMTEMKEAGGQISFHREGDEIEPGMTLEEMIRRSLETGTNSMEPALGGANWKNQFYDPMDKWQEKLGLSPTKRATHMDYQKDVTNLLTPQVIKLMKNGEMGLTNKHRAQLKKSGVPNADKIVSFKELTNEDLQKVGDTESFLKTGYEDGLAGHRGVTVLEGDATEEEYAAMNREYDKLTDADGRKVYAKYNDDGTIKRSSDGKLVFYYPKTGKKVPEVKAPEVPGVPGVPNIPKKSPYRPPVLPPQRAIAPSAASPVPIYENRLDRYDPMKVGYDQQVSEIYRQANSVTPQLEGLTDTQRTSALANISANTQKNISDVVNSTAVQNAMSLFQNQEINSKATDTEEAMRVANARAADEMWGKTEAFQEADNRDYEENVQKLRLGRFNYLTKDRQIHDMVENYKVGADGGFEFDPNSAVQITIGGVPYLKDTNGNIKKIDTTKQDNKGNLTTSSTTIQANTKKP